MTWIVALSGIVFLGLGALGGVSPGRLLTFLTWWHEGPRLFAAAAFRVVLGVASLGAAPLSRAPAYLLCVGAIALLFGLATPWLGAHRFAARLGAWRAVPPTRVRPWCALPIALGLSLLWTVLPD